MSSLGTLGGTGPGTKGKSHRKSDKCSRYQRQDDLIVRQSWRKPSITADPICGTLWVSLSYIHTHSFALPGRYFRILWLYATSLKTKHIFVLNTVSCAIRKVGFNWANHPKTGFFFSIKLKSEQSSNVSEAREGKRVMKINHVIWSYHFLGSL